MDVQLNNKIYSGRLLEKGGLKINLVDKFDILFFKEWIEKAFNIKTGEMIYKYNYANDVKFTTYTEMGTLKGCFPILSLNEDFVVLKWDLKNDISHLI